MMHSAGSWTGSAVVSPDAGGEERRGELRIDDPAAVFVELPVGPDHHGEQPPLLLCRLLDFSANGMRIRIDRHIAPGTILRISARLRGDRQLNTLVVRVRWSCPDGNAFSCGLSLFEAADTDIAEWKRKVSERLGHKD